MSLLTALKKKEQTTLCKSSSTEICFGGYSILYGRLWSGKERAGVCPARPAAPAATGPGDAATPHMHRLGSHWLQAGSKRCQQPEVTLQASHGLPLQTMQHFLQYFPSRASLKRYIICIQSEKPHFVIKTLRSIQQADPGHVLAGHQPLPACFVPALQQVELAQNSQQSLVSWNPILWGWKSVVLFPTIQS